MRATRVIIPVVIILLVPVVAIPARAADVCGAQGAEAVIDSKRGAACYLLYVAEELVANRDWCVALTGEDVAWQVTLDLWVRRNREYLDSAVRAVTSDESMQFELDSPLLEDREPAVQVNESQCRRDRRALDEGRFDVDLVPLLRPLKRFLADGRH